MGGGDPGDGGASDRAAADRVRKATASADINRIFGQDTGTGTEPPSPEAFVSGDLSGRHFDQPAYERALADYNAAQEASGGEARTNRAARERLYANTRQAGFDLNKTSLDQQKEAADRELKFALARSGLFGGSADVDQHALEQRTYDRGVLDIGNAADANVADLRSQDENSRLGLLTQIQAGVDAGSALSGARDALSINAARADAAARGTQIGRLFDNIGLLYDSGNQAAGANSARGAYPWWARGGGGATFNTPGTSGRIS